MMKGFLKNRIWYLLILQFFISKMVFASDLLVEAESFEHKGGWVLDQQFMNLMGSPYLMAHGIGKPVSDATTTVTFPEMTTYNVFVRTFNWVSPWFNGEGPGKFQLKVGKSKLPVILGTKGNEWNWQFAGKVLINEKSTKLSLIDLTGFNGRCDAIYFTTNQSQTFPTDSTALSQFRLKKLNTTSNLLKTKSYDFVVVGGGVAGMCAAVAGARLGCKVALLQNRPILGGNNSSDVRVHLGGTIEVGKNKGLGRMIREFGHTNEGNAKPKENYEDSKKYDFVTNEKNVDLFLNYQAVAVNKKGDNIESIIAQNVESGEQICFVAPIFSDCTGDGTVGYLAGADFKMGRESRDEFGEELAPEKADKMTMGASVQWYSINTNSKVNFPKFTYGVKFDESNCERVSMGEWKWETGMNFDQIKDFERIRDYGLLVVFSNWSFLKNEYKEKEKFDKKDLAWVAYVAGKRESRRLLGDYVLKQDDIDKNVFHEDASFTTTWSIDLHTPDSVNKTKFPGSEFKAQTKHINIYPYSVPYRCLYSRNVDNLFMAGRDISVTHVALGTVRVMRTTGMMGEVVGMAASLCKKYQTKPRKIYQSHLEELKEIMKAGAGKTDSIPDNQNFNEQKPLVAPRFQ